MNNHQTTDKGKKLGDELLEEELAEYYDEYYYEEEELMSIYDTGLSVIQECDNEDDDEESEADDEENSIISNLQQQSHLQSSCSKLLTTTPGSISCENNNKTSLLPAADGDGVIFSGNIDSSDNHNNEVSFDLVSPLVSPKFIASPKIRFSAGGGDGGGGKNSNISAELASTKSPLTRLPSLVGNSPKSSLSASSTTNSSSQHVLVSPSKRPNNLSLSTTHHQHHNINPCPKLSTEDFVIYDDDDEYTYVSICSDNDSFYEGGVASSHHPISDSQQSLPLLLDDDESPPFDLQLASSSRNRRQSFLSMSSSISTSVSSFDSFAGDDSISSRGSDFEDSFRRQHQRQRSNSISSPSASTAKNTNNNSTTTTSGDFQNQKLRLQAALQRRDERQKANINPIERDCFKRKLRYQLTRRMFKQQLQTLLCHNRNGKNLDNNGHESGGSKPAREGLEAAETTR